MEGTTILSILDSHRTWCFVPSGRLVCGINVPNAPEVHGMEQLTHPERSTEAVTCRCMSYSTCPPPQGFPAKVPLSPSGHLSLCPSSSLKSPGSGRGSHG